MRALLEQANYEDASDSFGNKLFGMTRRNKRIPAPPMFDDLPLV
jgi:hypothetical protein